MRNVKVYRPPGEPSQVEEVIDGLDPKLREKVIWQIFRLAGTPLSWLKEPHYKHFAIERYQELYELREKGKVMIRVVFTRTAGGEILLLYAFVKKQKRDTMRALDQALGILAEIRACPERAVEYKVKEEGTA